MDTKNQSKKKRFSVYNVNFESKLYISLFSLLIIGLFVTTRVSIRQFNIYIEHSSQDNLSQLVDVKKTTIEEKVKAFKNEFSVFANQTIQYNAIRIKDAFNNFDLYDYNDLIDPYNVTLTEYYKDEIIGKIKWHTPAFEDIYPKDSRSIVLQTLFIANNPNPDQKEKLLHVQDDNSTYNSVHGNLHPLVRDLSRKWKVSNVYLIDGSSGNVLYNMSKNITLGTNLYNGPYQASALSTVFQKALADKGNVVISDYEAFVPNLNNASGYAAISLNDDNAVVMVAEIGPDFFQNFIFDEWMFNKDEATSLSIVGPDHLIRTNDIRSLIDNAEFSKKIAFNSRKNVACNNALNVGASAFQLGYPKSLDLNKRELVISDNYLNEKSFIYTQSLELENLGWSIVAENNIKKSRAFIRKTRRSLWIAISFTMLFAFGVLKTAIFSVTSRLKRLDKAIHLTLKGEKCETITTRWNDELAKTVKQFNFLRDKMENASNFAIELSNGNLENQMPTASENDNFANALNTLKETLKSNKLEADKRATEDKIAKWINEGIAKFNDLLRQSNDNISELAYLIIENLIEYLEINQGGIYMVDGDNEHDKKINLTASFAYDRRKNQNKTIEIGDGLIGNCYLEKKPIHLKKIPQDYIEITSGLGQSTPSSLYIVPLMIDDNVLGFIELASFNDFVDYKVDFINKLADNIAATFSSVKLNTRTAVLLEESKRRANEIAQQEEEMRQNMEEMQATQEELARVRDEDERRTQNLTEEVEACNRMIQQLLNGMDGEVLLKDSQGVIVLANEEAAKRYSSTPDKLIGKSDDDLMTPERAKQEREIDQSVQNEGFYSEEIVEFVGTEDVKYFIVKKQFFLPNRKEQGVLTIRNKRS